MKKMYKILGLMLLLAVTGCTLAACGGGSASSSNGESSSSSDSAVEKIKAAGKIVWVTNAEFEPFEFKQGNDVVGIDADIAQAIADDLGVELEISDIAFESTIPALTSGKADFCAAGMTVTDERKKNVDFSTTYYDATQALIVPTGSEITKVEDLDGKTVGVQTGTTGDTFCTDADGANSFKIKEIKRYNKGMDAVSDLLTGRVDAVVIDDFPATKLVDKNSAKIQKLDTPVANEGEQYAIAVNKGSDLLDEINKVLADLDSSGKMEEIANKY